MRVLRGNLMGQAGIFPQAQLSRAWHFCGLSNKQFNLNFVVDLRKLTIMLNVLLLGTSYHYSGDNYFNSN